MSSPVWERHWAQALGRVEHSPLSPRTRDPLWVRNTFLLLEAEEKIQTAQAKDALEILEQVILPFRERHFPYWNAREPLGDLYHAAGRDDVVHFPGGFAGWSAQGGPVER